MEKWGEQIAVIIKQLKEKDLYILPLLKYKQKIHQASKQEAAKIKASFEYKALLSVFKDFAEEFFDFSRQFVDTMSKESAVFRFALS